MSASGRSALFFQRPNPEWDDIGILADEIEGSGDAKREVVLTAPRSGSILKTKGLLKFVREQLKLGKHPMSNVIIAGKRPGDAGETEVSSEKSAARHVAALPVTDDEKIYRRRFITVTVPFVRIAGKKAPSTGA